VVAISAVSYDNIWAVGQRFLSDRSSDPTLALIEHWDGRGWTLMDGADLGGESASLSAVTALGRDDVWAIGQHEATSSRHSRRMPLIEHWDGQSWSLAEVDPSPPAGVFVPTALAAIDAVGRRDVWVLGRAGVNGLPGSTTSRDSFLHWNGRRWSYVSSPQDERSWGSSTMQDVSAVRSDDVWAVGGRVNGHSEAGRAAGSRIERWDGHAWALFSDGPRGDVPLVRVAVIGADDMWAIRGGDFENGEGGYGFGPDSIVHWDGAAWHSTYRLPHREAASLIDLDAADPGGVWGVGQSRPGRPLIVHWTAKRWREPADAANPPPLGGQYLRPALSIAQDGTVAVFTNRQSSPGPSIGNNLWIRCP
jgi:hypothetical protein